MGQKNEQLTKAVDEMISVEERGREREREEGNIIVNEKKWLKGSDSRRVNKKESFFYSILSKREVKEELMSQVYDQYPYLAK